MLIGDIDRVRSPARVLTALWRRSEDLMPVPMSLSLFRTISSTESSW